MDQIKANPIQKENIKESDANTNQQQVIQQQREQEFNPQQSGQMHLQNKKLYKPNFIFCEDNNNMEKLLKTYPHLKTLKEAEDQDFEKIEDAKAYIIRSNTDDDIHKAIKYGVWCSTPPNNEMLDKAFEEAEEKNIPIYLFFSVVKSGQFVGIAKLKSGLQDKNFAFWWQHSKWRGCFDVEWVFVKDIVYKQFENLVNKEDKPVNRSKDGTEIDWKSTGLPMIQKYKEDKSSKSIFNQFQIFDQREQFQRWRYDPKNQFPQIKIKNEKKIFDYFFA
ncbi:hypothetical protein PPERSA_08104 [Pseudocohnilembus persalinus]|uniref:YTH domain-containing protein n=1 Tax=Pseudocohnilembus persalinus TaxID=266149 RepID=A0A0V0QM42_PSEPJ|nr:hypothetical protein PPERSA_08104 [Pseudocohnilembus persalinus]|eukprot:KRX03029.1 hypothetical protein PPERSA_08104 [Pseudocohnilembus persalinus]